MGERYRQTSCITTSLVLHCLPDLQCHTKEYRRRRCFQHEHDTATLYRSVGATLDWWTRSFVTGKPAVSLWTQKG